jgi:hypothetical protein
MHRLRAGLMSIGLRPGQTWDLLQKAAFDSIPEPRRSVFSRMLRNDQRLWGLKRLANELHYPETTIRREAEALEAYGVLERERQSKSDLWCLSAWTRQRLSTIGVVGNR